MTAMASDAASLRGLARLGGRLGGLSGRKRYAAAFLAGGLSALAFEPFRLIPLLLLAYAVLVLLLDGVGKPGRMTKFALTGWAFGFGQFLVGLYWIAEAFTVDAASHGWQIPFVLILLPGGLALFPALACAAASLLWHRGLSRILFLAVALALAQYLRGHVLTGFPWNLAAYGWGAVPEILQSVSVQGVYGLSLLTLLLGCSLAEFCSRGGRWTFLFPLFLLLLFALLWLWGSLRLMTPVPDVPNLRLRIVQPNIPENEKFDPRFAVRNWQRLLSLSGGPKDGPPTLIVWPESAPPFLLEQEPFALDEIALLTGNNRMLITGAARMTAGERGRRIYYNSVYFFGSNGRLQGIYDKFHLVPFGEYLPLESFFHALGIDKLVNSPGGFTPGPGPRTISLPGAPKAGPLVCYEIIFPGEVTGHPRPDWLVNVTNDAWFGTFSGPFQHFLIARVRAIEEGLPIVRAAGTGISAIIDPMGRVKVKLGLGHMGAIDGTLPQALPPTFYARHGDVLFAGLLVFLAGLAGIVARPKEEP